MRNMLIAMALVLGLSTSAFANDFDNTGISVSAESEKFGVSLSTGATRDFSEDARVLGVYTTSQFVNLGVQYAEDGDVDDFRINLNKRGELALGAFTAYGVAEAHYDFGDSFDKNELLLSPYVGIELRGISTVVPFVEAGYDWKSVEGDYLDFSGEDSYAKVGGRFSVTPNTVVTVGVMQRMDTDLNKADREAQVAFAVKF